MNIVTVGAGRMASTLGGIWARAGHAVYFGSRSTARGEGVAEDVGHGARGGLVKDGMEGADLVLLAVPGSAVVRTAASLDLPSGVTLLDLSNPLGVELKEHASLAEAVQAAQPSAHVVKAFNYIHFLNLDHPRFGGVAAAGFYCGDDPEARARVRRLVEETGLDPLDAGPLANARLLEAAALLWIDLAFQRGQPAESALALLRRQGHGRD